jgi:hypothetical protein
MEHNCLINQNVESRPVSLDCASVRKYKSSLKTITCSAMFGFLKKVLKVCTFQFDENDWTTVVLVADHGVLCEEDHKVSQWNVCSIPIQTIFNRLWVLQVMFPSVCSFIMLVFTVFHYMFRPTWPSSSV